MTGAAAGRGRPRPPRLLVPIGMLALLALTPAFAADAGAGAVPWWVWPALLFVVCFALGIVAVPAGVGVATGSRCNGQAAATAPHNLSQLECDSFESEYRIAHLIYQTGWLDDDIPLTGRPAGLAETQSSLLTVPRTRLEIVAGELAMRGQKKR